MNLFFDKYCSKRLSWNERRKQKFKSLIKFTEYFGLFIKKCYRIVWSEEKNTESKNPKGEEKENGRIMLLSKRAVCDSKKSKFIKRGASGLLSSLGIEKALSKIALVGPLLF